MEIKSISKRAILAALLATGLPIMASAQTEVRWGQWKTTEVGEKLMAEIKAAFEKDHPDVKLTIVDSPFTGFHDRSVVQHQAKRLPDVLMIQVDWVAEFADLGMIEPLDPFMAKDPSLFEKIPVTFHAKWKGKQYYVPLETGSVALFYNTDIFAAAGVAGPPKTWEEFAEITKKVTNADKKIYGVTGTLASEPPTNMTYDIYPLILHNGGKIIDGNKAAFNSPEGIAAVEAYLKRNNVDKIVAPGILSNGEKEKRANFASGNIAMMFEGPWGISIQRQLNPNLKFDVAPLPTGKTNGTMVRGSLNTMSAQAQNKDAAWKLIKWLSGPAGNEMWAKGSGAFPANMTVGEKDWFKERKIYSAFVTQMGWSNAQSPFLNMPNAVQMNKIITTEIQIASQGKKSVNEALDAAAGVWDKILAAAK